MDKAELLARLDIILGTECTSAYGAFNQLNGALIRVTQAYGDSEVTERVDRLWRRAVEFTPREKV